MLYYSSYIRLNKIQFATSPKAEEFNKLGIGITSLILDL